MLLIYFKIELSYKQNEMREEKNLNINELVEKAQAGERAAFSEIVKMMLNQVNGLTFKMTGDSEAAMDLAQDSFVAAWSNIGSFKKEAKFQSWVYRIAINKTLNYLKQAKRVTEPYVDELPSLSNPENDLHKKELRLFVKEFMMTLPSEQRLVFELRFYKQMSFNETAEMTGKALGTVKTLYREALKKLRHSATVKGWHK